MNITELRQFSAFTELGSFSEVARKFYSSTPTVARNMARVEKYFGVPLFEREKNRVELTETGKRAVAHVTSLLRELDAAAADVREFDRGLRSIIVASCAPAPLWVLLPRISRLYPGVEVASRVMGVGEVEQALTDGRCDVAVLPHRPDGEGFVAKRLMKEGLLLCVRGDHPLAGRERVTLDELNGYNFLLGTDLGFWNDVVRGRLTASRFLVQDDEYSLTELIRTSTLPCFTTDVAIAHRYRDLGEGRVNVPIADPEVNVTYWLVARADASDKVGRLFGR